MFRHDNEELQLASDAVNASWLRNPFWTKAFGDALDHRASARRLRDGRRRARAAWSTTAAASSSGPEGTDTHRRPVRRRRIDRAPAARREPAPDHLGARRTRLRAPHRRARLATDAARRARRVRPRPSRPQRPACASPSGCAATSRPRCAAPTTTKPATTRARSTARRIEFVVTVDADDVDRLVARPLRCRSGSRAPSSRPGSPLGRMTIVDGTFTLFDPDPQRVETSLMRYRMPLVGGRRATVPRRGPQDDAPRLPARRVDLDHDARGHGARRRRRRPRRRACSASRPPTCSGRPPRCESPEPRVAPSRRRASLDSAAGSREELVTSYGGDRGARRTRSTRRHRTPPRPRAPTRRPRAPSTAMPDGNLGRHVGRTTRSCASPDTAAARRGPVLLAPGFGMSTAAFATDTIDTNLTEYLVEHGYDVWLFDPRWSPDLQSSRSSFSLDDVATVDWPTGRRRRCAA